MFGNSARQTSVVEHSIVVIEFGALVGNGDYGNSLRVVHPISDVFLSQHRDTRNRHCSHFEARSQAALPLRNSRQHNDDTVTAADPLR